MRKCIRCKSDIINNTHDLCHLCFDNLEKSDFRLKPEEHFKKNLQDKKTPTAYIMFYKNKSGPASKFGYTNDLEPRIIEIKKEYPENNLVYFREFMTESQARRYESWLKKQTERDINRLVSDFRNKLSKVVMQ